MKHFRRFVFLIGFILPLLMAVSLIPTSSAFSVLSDEVIITNLIDQARQTGQEVQLENRIYILNSPVYVAYNLAKHGGSLRIRGYENTVLDITRLNGLAILFYGTPTATETFPLGNIYEGNESISVADVSGFVAGDWVRVSSSKRIGSNTAGEIRRISSITGNTITLQGGMDDTYLLTDSTKIVQIIVVTNLTIGNLTIRGNPSNAETIGLRVDYGSGIKVENVRVENTPTAALQFGSVVGGTVRYNAISGANRVGYGYAAVVYGASRNFKYYNNQVSNSTKALTVGGGPAVGITRYTRAYDNIAANMWHGFETHGEAEHTIFSRNQVNRSFGHSYNASDDDVTFWNNTATEADNNGVSSDATISVGGPIVRKVTISNNYLQWNKDSISPQSWGIRVHPDAVNIQSIRITGNTIVGYEVPIYTWIMTEDTRIENNIILP